MKTKLIFSLFLCFFTISQYLQADITDDSTGVSFPSQVTIEHENRTYKLDATGVSTRKKFFVKVYSIASYLENGIVTSKGNAFNQILEDNKAKQVTMKWVHEASASKIQDGLRDSFSKVLSKNEQTELKKYIDEYIAFFNVEARVGDEHVIQWLPGGYLEVLINGKSVGNITNIALAKAVFSFWFGDNSVVNRNDLIKELK
jgi:hypothetical protein